MNLERSTTYYETDRMYSITINPSDKYQYNGRQYRLKHFRNFVSEHIIDNIDCDYTFVIELSEPHQNLTQGTSGPRLHLHGLITFRTKQQLGQFLTIGLYKLLRHSYIDIDTIDNELRWIDYMFKQQILSDDYKVISNTIEESLTKEAE